MEKSSTGLQDELNALKQAKESLQAQLENELKDKESIENQAKLEKAQIRSNIFNAVVEQSQNIIKEAIAKFDDPVLLNCKSGAEYLLTLLHPSIVSLQKLNESFAKDDQSNGILKA